MSLALYRKYRSATFGELIGQEHVATTLRNQVRRGEVAHGYLFAGIRGTGKTSTARILARAVVCLDPRDGEPCNRCAACQEVLGDRTVDVLEIDAASNRGIDDIRQLRENVKFLPATLRRKVYIVDEAHMLTTDAWNGFLKTLEEPPPHVLFVLATTEPHKVPETVRSRVQRFDFRRVGLEELGRHLAWVCAQEGAAAAPEAVALVAAAGEGSVRDALSILELALAGDERPLGEQAVRRALGLADPDVLRRTLMSVAAGDAGGALRGLAAAFEGGGDARQLLREMARLARGAELVAVGYAEGAELGGGDVALCHDLATAGRAGLWVDAIDRFAEAEVNLRQPVDARLQVELAVLRLCHGAATPAQRPASGIPPQSAAAPADPQPGDTANPRGGAVAAAPDPPAPAAAAPRPAAAAPPLPVAAAAPRPAATIRPAPVATAPAPPAPTADVEAGPSASAAVPPPTPGGEESPSRTPSAAAAAGAPADLGGWVAAFPRVIEALGRRDPMLAGVLRSCRPVEGGSGRVVIGAPFGFHLERLRDAQKAPALTEAAAAIAGGPVIVETVFLGGEARAERTAPRHPDEPDATSAALATFPGSRLVGSRLRDPGPQWDAPAQP